MRTRSNLHATRGDDHPGYAILGLKSGEKLYRIPSLKWKRKGKDWYQAETSLGIIEAYKSGSYLGVIFPARASNIYDLFGLNEARRYAEAKYYELIEEGLEVVE